jgi:malate synthase
MAAFIPSRRDPEVNEAALAKVREYKQRESGQGFDGTWVAHPDLVPVATEIFDSVLGDRANQVERLREDVVPDAAALIDFEIPGSSTTEAGLHQNVSVGTRYLDAWLRGTGAAAIDNLMEDAATAEISRAQVWSWVKSGRFTRDDVERELAAVEAADDAKELFAEVALGEPFVEFLTLPAYERLA